MGTDRISVSNVSFVYPNGFNALDNVSLELEPGSKTAIVGLNGAGKTTLAKLLNGLLKPSKGIIKVGDLDTSKHTTATIAKKVGYVFQNPDDQIFNSSVIKEIEYMPRYLKLSRDIIDTRVAEAIELTQLGNLMNENPLEIPLSTRKFIAIAAVLVVEPKYIILDEPTAGQDLRGLELLENIIDYCQGKGIGVVTITHDMEFMAENFSRIIAMANKRIVMDGTVQEVMGNVNTLQECKIMKPQVAQFADNIGVQNCPIKMGEVYTEYKKYLNC